MSADAAVENTDIAWGRPLGFIWVYISLMLGMLLASVRVTAKATARGCMTVCFYRLSCIGCIPIKVGRKTSSSFGSLFAQIFGQMARDRSLPCAHRSTWLKVAELHGRTSQTLCSARQSPRIFR